MHIEFEIHPTATTSYEASVIEAVGPDFRYQLDIDFAILRRKLTKFDPVALDLLFIAACVYGVDKAVERLQNSEDGWTRDLSLAIPVQNPELWTNVEERLATCLSFLTGDRWGFTFSKANRSIYQPRRLKKRVRWNRIYSKSFSLFSGGLDSFIGAIDHLEGHPKLDLALIGHYEKHVKGPASDQNKLVDELRKHFPGRINQLQCRIGLTEPGAEHSYRSRSFLFLALGVLAAASVGPDIPVIMPENGPIAVNYPLIPSRRGSCSTRTAHPHFLACFQDVLDRAGVQHQVVNPYAFDTKGEMIENCKRQDIVKAHYALSRSCAKFGRKTYWPNTTAHQCGICVPCIFRRAALHKVGWDSEVFGYDFSADVSEEQYAKDAYADVRALTAFVQRNDDERTIRRELLSNGPLRAADVSKTVQLVQRMRDEVRVWLKAKACNRIKSNAGLVTA